MHACNWPRRARRKRLRLARIAIRSYDMYSYDKLWINYDNRKSFFYYYYFLNNQVLMMLKHDISRTKRTEKFLLPWSITLWCTSNTYYYWNHNIIILIKSVNNLRSCRTWWKNLNIEICLRKNSNSVGFVPVNIS